MKIKLLPGESITAICAADASTTEPKAIVGREGRAGPATDIVTLTGDAAVDLLTSVDAAGDVLTSLSIYNVDTAAVTVTINKKVSGTPYPITKKTLQVGDTLLINGDDGIVVTDVNGQVKTVLVQTAASRVEAAVTATTGGGTTGLIPAGATHIVVTSDSVNKTISLPAAAVGDVIRIKMGATGCELISSVATHKVNDVLVGATNEAALVATNIYRCEYVATDEWIVTATTKLGAVVTALVPDALN